MKMFFFFLLLFGLIFVAQGEILVTKSGRKFHDYKITEASSIGVKIVHRDGINMVIFSDLPDNVAQMYSTDLKTKSGNVYENYSVTRVSHNKMKITHKFGTLWIPHDELPEFLLEKYTGEIREKKKKNRLREQKQSADREKQRQEREISEAIRKARETGNDQEAVKILQRAAEAYPQHDKIGQVRMVLSHKRALLETRKKIEAAYSSLTCAEAIRHLEEALKLSPNEEHPRAQKWLKIFKEAQNYGFTPIMIAVYHNDMTWCDKLFAQGADINDKSNNVPLLGLYLANKNFKIQMFDYLLSRKADVNLAEDKAGNTPLMIACRKQPIEIVKKLVQAGARVNLRNRNGETSLHFAMTRKDDQIPALVRYLISQGAKKDIRSNDGSRPEDMLSDISNRRVRYETSLILKDIALPAVTKFASWDGTEGVVNWKISISQLESDGYSFSSLFKKPGFICYSNGSTHCYFSQKTGELAWVIFNDTEKYNPYTRAKKMLHVQCEFLQKYYGQIELVKLPARTSRTLNLVYWAYIVPFRGTLITSCGLIGQTTMHQLRVLNPAYFPTDEEYIREIYDQL